MSAVLAYYHVAAIGHWREVVLEQLRLLARAGFPYALNLTFIGSPDDAEFVTEIGDDLGLQIDSRIARAT